MEESGSDSGPSQGGDVRDSAGETAAAAVGRAVEEVRAALNEHADVVAELFGRVSTELRGGFGPAVDTFVGFFHAVDWKVRLFSLIPPASLA